MKTSKSFFFVLLITLVFLCSAVFACAETSGNFVYTKNETNTGVIITDYLGSDTALTVPNKLDGLPVVGIGDYAFRNQYTLNKVSLPSSVLTIGDGAFAGCTSLTSVSFANDPDELGVFVFDGCNNLTLPVGKTSVLYEYARTYGIKYVLTSGNENEFTYSLKGELLTLESYNGQGGVVTVPQTAVYENKSYYVTYIGDEAFAGARNVTQINLSASVEKIGRSAFEGCSNLQAVNVNSQNVYYSSVDGVLFNADKTVLLLYPAAKNSTEYTVPSTVMEISYEAFKGNVSLKKVVIPASVDTVGYYAFCDCSALSTIEVSDSLRYVGVGSFENTAWLNAQTDSLIYIGNVLCNVRDKESEIVLADTTKALAAYVFENASFTSLLLPEGLEVIHTGAFKNCTALTTINLPATVMGLKAYAFEGCTALADVFFNGDGINMEKNLFGDLRSVMFHCEEDTDAFCFAQDYQYAVYGKDLRVPAVSLISVRRNTMTASWAEVEGATGYNIYLRSPSSSSYKKINATPVTATSYTFGGLAAGAKYSFYVTAVNAADANNVTESYKGTVLSAVMLNGVLGDVDQDGTLSLKDMISAFQHVSGSLTLNDASAFVADVDYDEKVTLNDVIMIFRAVSGSITLQ